MAAIVAEPAFVEAPWKLLYKYPDEHLRARFEK